MSLGGRSNPFIDYLIQFIAVSVIVTGAIAFLTPFVNTSADAPINWTAQIVVPVLSVAIALGIHTFLKLDTVIKNSIIRYFIVGVVWLTIVIGLSATSVGGCTGDECGDVIGSIADEDVKTYGIAGFAFLLATILITQAQRFMNRV